MEWVPCVKIIWRGDGKREYSLLTLGSYAAIVDLSTTHGKYRSGLFGLQRTSLESFEQWSKDVVWVQTDRCVYTAGSSLNVSKQEVKSSDQSKCFNREAGIN